MVAKSLVSTASSSLLQSRGSRHPLRSNFKGIRMRGLSDTPSIPGWPSLTPGDTAVEPNPYPGSISDFDAAISHYEVLYQDARYQVIRNKDADRLETKRRRETIRYIARQNKLIAERSRKGLAIPDEIHANIASAREEIKEADEVLSLLPDHREPWCVERSKRRQLVSDLRDQRAKGIGKDGKVRKCGSKTQDGSPCQNEKHYRKGSEWGPCLTTGH